MNQHRPQKQTPASLQLDLRLIDLGLLGGYDGQSVLARTALLVFQVRLFLLHSQAGRLITLACAQSGLLLFTVPSTFSSSVFRYPIVTFGKFQSLSSLWNRIHLSLTVTSPLMGPWKRLLVCCLIWDWVSFIKTEEMSPPRFCGLCVLPASFPDFLWVGLKFKFV